MGEFSRSFGRRGRPVFSSGLLALVTVPRRAGNLTDRQAADAAREDVTWKRALGLSPADEGFGVSVLWGFGVRVAVPASNSL
jgi:hypothetical protein